MHDSRCLDLLTINIVLNIACLLNLMQVKTSLRIKRAATAWTAAILVLATVLALVRLPREILERWHYTQQQTINLSAFLATGDSGHLLAKPSQTIPLASAERLVTLVSDPSIRSILPWDIMPPVRTRTRKFAIAVARAVVRSVPCLAKRAAAYGLIRLDGRLTSIDLRSL